MVIVSKNVSKLIFIVTLFKSGHSSRDNIAHTDTTIVRSLSRKTFKLPIFDTPCVNIKRLARKLQYRVLSGMR